MLCGKWLGMERRGVAHGMDDWYRSSAFRVLLLQLRACLCMCARCVVESNVLRYYDYYYVRKFDAFACWLLALWVRGFMRKIAHFLRSPLIRVFVFCASLRLLAAHSTRSRFFRSTLELPSTSTSSPSASSAA